MEATPRKTSTITLLPPPPTTPKANAAAERFAFSLPAPPASASATPSATTSTAAPPITSSKARPSSKKRTRAELEGTIRELTRQLRGAQAEASLCREYRAKRAEALQEKEALQAENAQLRQQLAASQAERVEKDGNIKRLRQDLASALHRFSRVTASLARKTEQLNSLEEHKTDNEAEHLAMAGSMASSVAAVGGLGPTQAGGSGGGGSAAGARAAAAHSVRLVVDLTEESPPSMDDEEGSREGEMMEGTKGDAEGGLGKVSSSLALRMDC